MDIEEFKKIVRYESEPLIRDKRFRYAILGCNCEKVYFAIVRDAVDEILNKYHDQIDMDLREGVPIVGMVNTITEMVDRDVLSNYPSEIDKMRQEIEEKVKTLPTDESLIELAKKYITNKKYLSKFEKKIEELYK